VEERRADEDVQSLDIYTTSLTADSEDVYTTAWTTDSEDAGGNDEEPCGPPPRSVRRADECAAANGGTWIRRPSDPHLRCSAGDGETDEGGWVQPKSGQTMSVSDTPPTPLTPLSPLSPGGSSLRARACLRKPSLSDLKVDTRTRKFNIQQCALSAAMVDYERLELLGRSNAEVFKVRCRKTDALRAVKVYSNDGQDPCKQEYEILQSMDHPSIPKVYQFYRGVRNSSFIMDFIPGATLEVARKGGQLSLADFMRVMEQLLVVLAHIHGLGLLHRDVSCDNLLYDPATGMLTLIDWNVAREYTHPDDDELDTARTLRAHSPTHAKRNGQELASHVAPDEDADASSTDLAESDCASDFSEYGKPSYREPIGCEGSPSQRDMYAAGVVLRMLRPSDPPPAVARVLAGLISEPQIRLSAQEALDQLNASRVIPYGSPQ
jgi:tRNA A-37 threonylcarbamoyl transferase component Bud32